MATNFPNRVLSGLTDLKTWITSAITSTKSTIESWCDGRFIKKSGNGFGNTALIEDSNGRVTGSNISSVELNMLDGVTSNIQQQINSHTSNTTVHVTSSERTTWNGKANKVHTHDQADITGLTTALAGKAANNHDHRTLYTNGFVGQVDNANGRFFYWINQAFTSPKGSSYQYVAVLTYRNTTSDTKKDIELMSPDDFTLITIMSTAYSGTWSYNRKGRADATISATTNKVTINVTEDDGKMGISPNECVTVFCIGEYQ